MFSLHFIYILCFNSCKRAERWDVKKQSVVFKKGFHANGDSYAKELMRFEDSRYFPEKFILTVFD